MSYLKIRSSALVELGTIYDILSCQRTERINSDNVLSFTTNLTPTITALIIPGNVVDLDGDYFDMMVIQKRQESDGRMTVTVECEHVSYRLNDPTYNKEYYAQIGTPTTILTEILEGTGFAVGTVNPTTTVTYSAQEATSRRGLLMGFVDLVEGEVLFDGFDVSILTRRGSATPVNLTATKDINVIDRTYNAREVDAEGNALITHTCSIIRPLTIALGDSVSLIYPSLDINTELRIVSLTTNPYNRNETSFEIGNFVPGLADDMYRIETSMVAKGSTYYGARISAENGFESVRNDNMARTVMNADIFAMQVGDGTGGNWTNKLYFDPATGKYTFDGTLSATMIEALEAEFDITISQTVIVNQLSAAKGNIAELTVDQIDTSDKVQRYLDEDESDVNYIRIDNQVVEFVTATRTGATGDVQLTNRNTDALYWTDDTFTGTTLNVTDYPVMVYNYIEQIKLQIEFVNDGGVYTPVMTFGVGTGVGDRLKGSIFKDANSFRFSFTKNDDSIAALSISADGVEVIGNTGSKGLRNIYIGTTPSTPQNNDLRIITV